MKKRGWRSPVLAQSGGADVHDRMSALGIAAEEIGRAPSVKLDVRDPGCVKTLCCCYDSPVILGGIDETLH